MKFALDLFRPGDEPDQTMRVRRTNIEFGQPAHGVGGITNFHRGAALNGVDKSGHLTPTSLKLRPGTDGMKSFAVTAPFVSSASFAI